MNSSQENRYMRSWTAGAALVLALGLAFPMASWAEPTITSVTGLQQGGTDVVRVELSEAADVGARRVRRAGAAAGRDRPAGREQCLGQVEHRGQPGQRALGERRQLRRPHAPGAEPEGAVELSRRDPGQVAADLARQRRRCGPTDGRARGRRRLAFRQQPELRRPRPARHRLPPRHRRCRPRRRQPREHAGGRRPEAAGQGSGHRLPALHGAGAGCAAAST